MDGGTVSERGAEDASDLLVVVSWRFTLDSGPVYG
jgi:hypothetical protein